LGAGFKGLVFADDRSLRGDNYCR